MTCEVLYAAVQVMVNQYEVMLYSYWWTCTGKVYNPGIGDGEIM